MRQPWYLKMLAFRSWRYTPVSKIITHQRRGHNVHLLVTWIHHTRGIPNSKIPRWIHHTRGIPISKTDSTPQNYQVQEWRQDNIYTQEKATWNFEVPIPIDLTPPSRKEERSISKSSMIYPYFICPKDMIDKILCPPLPQTTSSC